MKKSDNGAMEKDLSRAVTKAAEKLLKQLVEMPSLIIEGGDSDDDDESTVTKIRSWLFRRSEGDDRLGYETEDPGNRRGT